MMVVSLKNDNNVKFCLNILPMNCLDDRPAKNLSKLTKIWPAVILDWSREYSDTLKIAFQSG